MDGVRAQALAYKGLRKSAQKAGLPFQVFRPNGTSDPMAPVNMVVSLPAAFSADDYRFKRPQGYAKPTWTVLIDGAQTQPGDYLSEVTALAGQDVRTFFIAAQQPLLPILAVACNATVTIARPTAQSGVGARQDGGNEAAIDVPTLTAWPCSMLAGTKGEKSDSGNIDDVRSPWMLVLLPPSASVADIRTDDVLTDAVGRRYLISGCELSPLGWKLTVEFEGA